MKTIDATTKKISLIIGLLMAALILLVFNSQAGNSPDPEVDLRYRTEIAKIEKATKQFNIFSELNKNYESPNQVYKFYDANEKLVYQVAIPATKAATDAKLLGYLHQSDLMLKSNTTSFYRFSK